MPTVADQSRERDLDETPVLEVRNLSVTFHDRRGTGRAVDDVSFVVQAGEAVGIVGESGSGKSVTAMAIMGLLPDNAEVSGEVLFRGVDLLALSPRARASYRGRHLSMILQDPMSSLDPVFTVRSQIGESLRLHQKLPRAQRRQTAIELLRLLQIPAPERVMGAYPHELSVGMRQRVAGAIALSCEPDILIADEPTTALDPTVQARYLDTIEAAQKRLEFGVIFITHDFGVVARLCSRVVVMYSGAVLESGPTATILREAENPYTKALLESVPDLHRPADALPSIPGAPPSIFAKPHGCPFSPRCPVVMDRCVEEVPPLATIDADHVSCCWRHE